MLLDMVGVQIQDRFGTNSSVHTLANELESGQENHSARHFAASKMDGITERNDAASCDRLFKFSPITY